MNKLRLATFLLLTIASGAATSAPQSFDALTCKTDIEQALVGRAMPNERVEALEKRYKNLELKDLGGYEVSDTLFLIFWRICGDEYALLQRSDRVTAALKTGKHVEGKEALICHPTEASKDVGVFIAAAGATRTKTGIVAERAWRIDEPSGSFVPATDGKLECAPEE